MFVLIRAGAGPVEIGISPVESFEKSSFLTLFLTIKSKISCFSVRMPKKKGMMEKGRKEKYRKGKMSKIKISKIEIIQMSKARSNENDSRSK